MSDLEEEEDRSKSPVSDNPDMKRGWIKDPPPAFSNEPGPSDTKERKRGPVSEAAAGLQEVLAEHKISLKRRCEHVIEGNDGTGSGTLLNRVYTEVLITVGQSEEVNTQHEVKQLEIASKMEALYDTPIKCQDIFKALPDQQGHIRVLLTNGVSGVGKTLSVQKFTLDWAEGLENQDVSVVIPLSFRELNLIRDEQYSLLELLHVFHPTLQKVTAEKLAVCKLLFIFDGLDESRLSLDFNNKEVVSDVTQKSSVSVLLKNLIKGNLLPSALVWITSRPTAANQIPPACVDRVTEVRGFTDAQKEEYLRRRVSDEERSSRIISHIQTSRSLNIMCLIPVFCWITATVLDHMLTTDQRGELPKTLTDLYAHFLLVQTKKKKQKYDKEQKTSPEELMEADREVLLKLGRLAFEQLQKGNIMFYQEDLERCGLDVTETSVYSGVCTEIFKRESVIFQKTVYCFVHLSVQEFLAAVYLFHCYTNRNTKVLEGFLGTDCGSSLDVFLKRAMEKSLESENGHLDMFVRFLHGLSLESNQRLLRDLLGQTDNSPEVIQRVINNLNEMNTHQISPDRSISIFHCLTDINYISLQWDIQKFLKSEKRLSEIHCSALAYILQMSEEALDELDLKRYNTTLEGRRRLIPTVKNCRKVVLAGGGLSATHWEVVASAMKSSLLRQLDLSNISLTDSAVEQLCVGLQNPNCKLWTLSLSNCGLSDISSASLASALRSNPSYVREVYLSENKLQDSVVKVLCEFLGNPRCRLETLRLRSCGLSEISCAFLASALKSHPTNLLKLQLSENKLQDSGVKLLCEFLESPNCRMEILRLRSCSLSEISCASLVSALKSNPSYLVKLELSNNDVRDSGVKLLCDFLENPDCRLETLSLLNCSLSESSCASVVLALDANPSYMTELQLSDNKLQDSGVKLVCDFLESPDCRLETLRLSGCSLSEISCASLASALESSPSYMRELELNENKMQDSGVKLLSDHVQNPNFRLETLRINNRVITAEKPQPGDSAHKLDAATNLPDDDNKGPLPFSPEQITATSYRFRCPGPGVFQCDLTRLVFVMAQAAEVKYKTLIWDDNILHSSRKLAAGPLFNIESSEESAVLQLHLPHCETKEALVFDGLMSVVHMTDDGMSILEPLEITDTHVVVNVPHPAAFGLIWDIIKRFLKVPLPIKGQVLLFLRPPYVEYRIVDVVVLQENIPVHEVVVQHKNSELLPISSDCVLSFGQVHSVHCEPQCYLIQPDTAEFLSRVGPNYHPTFEVFLTDDMGNITLTVQDQEKTEVWKRLVLMDPIGEFSPRNARAKGNLPADKKLLSARIRFIHRVAEPVLNRLLDDLLERHVITDDEMMSITETNRASTDKARGVIDAVRKKGAEASSALIAAVREVDPGLSEVLKLS